MFSQYIILCAALCDHFSLGYTTETESFSNSLQLHKPHNKVSSANTLLLCLKFIVQQLVLVVTENHTDLFFLYSLLK